MKAMIYVTALAAFALVAACASAPRQNYGALPQSNLVSFTVKNQNTGSIEAKIYLSDPSCEQRTYVGRVDGVSTRTFRLPANSFRSGGFTVYVELMNGAGVRYRTEKCSDVERTTPSPGSTVEFTIPAQLLSLDAPVVWPPKQ